VNCGWEDEQYFSNVNECAQFFLAESVFHTRFQIQAFTKGEGEDEDSFLPEAQTCFFSLSLPSYSSEEVMREKLLYAINTCKEIDTDFVVTDSYIHDDEDEYTNDSDSENEDLCVTQ
jgi:hypothetical protein